MRLIIIYTTNAIESLNSMFWAAFRECSVFPTDYSVKNVIYLKNMDTSKKWNMSIQKLRPAMTRFIIEFGIFLRDHR
ncbi:transposase [Salmonella enterica]|nr:transposase [Salmonella enterica subsp. enterica serovar Muenchen]ECQ3651777.1 transposase [Salmonella enterica]EDV4825287.1 transposase [Salmonella enterica]EKS5644403.1 transposase [Salmonella enterica]EKS5828636.1 transposase [Salmonella enterica]